MARPGTKPKPTALKKLAGNPGRRPLNEREPQYGLESTSAPRSRLNNDGKRLWRTLAPRLGRVGLLTEVDKATLEMLCLHYQMVRQAVDAIEEYGLFAAGSQGQTVAHPAVAILNANSAAFRRYATEFGLTPSSRTRLEIPERGEEETLAEALFRIAGSPDAD